MTTKISSDNIQPTTLELLGGSPTITSVTITDSSYTAIDDTAISLGGGYIKITGTKFASGCSVVVNKALATSVTFVSATEVRAQLPAQTAGTYVVYVINSDGSVAIRVNGITYSATPSWVTGSELPVQTVDDNISVQLSASEATSYAVQAGSTIPTGLTLAANGLLSGIITGITEDTTYNFIVEAIDAENQESPRTFSVSVTVGDPYWPYVTMLLSSQMNTVPFNGDVSTNKIATTLAGDTRPSNFGPYTPGYYSNYFDGTGDYLTNTTDNTAIAPGAGDFTIESWLYVVNSAVAVILDTRINTTTATGGFQIAHDSGTINVYGGASTNVLLVSGSITYNTWNHVAVVRNGNSSGNVKLYINGFLVSTYGSTDTNNYTQGYLNIGMFRLAGTPSSFYTGYLSNLRIVKGTAVYTSTFTSPTSPLTAIANTVLLTCQSNRFIDNSTNNFTLTHNGDVGIEGFDPFVPATDFAGRGSTFFDGAGDYISMGYVSSLSTAGSTPWTLEAWIHPTALTSTRTITTVGGTTYGWSAGSGYQHFLSINTSGNLVFQYYVSNNVQANFTSGSALAIKRWTHVAVTYDGTTIRMFLNGALSNSSAVTLNAQTGLAAMTIGGSGNVSGGGDYFNGFMADVRFVRGTAVYTTAFTPPTQPLTAISGTALLTCQTNQPINNNTFLDNSTSNITVTRAGNTTQSSVNPYGGGWSNYFDGSGDQLSVASSVFTYSSNFTMECWFYAGTAGGAEGFGLAFSGNTANNAQRFQLGVNAAGAIYTYVESSGASSSTISSATGTVTTNRWYHAAFVKNSTTLTIYLDGVSVGSGTLGVTPTLLANFYIGFLRSSGTLQYITGYISNFRVINGTALYTSNFTPSASPLTPVNGTTLLTCADNRIVDDSPNNLTITRAGDVRVEKFNPFKPQAAPVSQSYSGYFGGSADYFTMASSASAYNFGVNVDFTVEAWVYPTALVGQMWGIIDARVSGATNASWLVGLVPSSGTYRLQFFNSGGNTGTAVIPLHAWTHVAVTRTGAALRTYVNGVLDLNSPSYGTGTISPGTTAPRIGTSKDASGTNYATNGLISNLRVVNGTAVYTADFTPPTQPLTAITNTVLLTCQSSRLVDNSTNNFAITSVGKSQPSLINPFGYTAGTKTGYSSSVYSGGMRFDGTGDYLTIPTSSFLPASTTYTIEMWIHPTAYPGGTNTAMLYHVTNNNVSSFGGLILNLYGSGNIKVESRNGNGGTNVSMTSSGTVPLNAWTHVSLSVNAGAATLYINGISSATATLAALDGTQQNCAIGYLTNGYVTGQTYFTGYISDARVVKGTAMYTGNFVPPNIPLTAVTNTALLLNGTSAAIYDSSMVNPLETVGDIKSTTDITKYGNSSILFDGNGDRLLIPYTPNMLSQVGRYTLEFWFYPTYNYTDQYLLGRNAGGYFGLGWNGTTGIIKVDKNGVGIQITSATSLALNQWHHVAMTYDGTTTRLFTNGTLQGSVSGTGGEASAATTIGYYEANGSSSFGGRISDFRFTRGVARYTSAFTPPTAKYLNR